MYKGHVKVKKAFCNILMKWHFFFSGNQMGEALGDFLFSGEILLISLHMPTGAGPGNRALVRATIDGFYGDKELPR